MTAGTAMQLSSALQFAPLPTAVSCARLHAVHVLHEWGLRGLADDAALVVSELITNAIDVSVVLSERPPVDLRLLATERSLLIEVWDRSPLGLEPREAHPGAESGRGLTVVAALSQRWGWKRAADNRKVVWAELALMKTGPSL
jgi:anti-sigma regulatory factor (Ser/Thr protein kinase)